MSARPHFLSLHLHFSSRPLLSVTYDMSFFWHSQYRFMLAGLVFSSIFVFWALTPTTYPEALAGRTRFGRWGRAGRGWNGSRQPPAAGHRASWPAGGQKSPLQQVGCRPLGGDRTHCGRAQVHTCPPALVPPGLTPYLSQKGSRCICSDRSPVQASSGWESGWPPGLQGQSAETEPPDHGTGDMADLRRGSS